MAVRKAVKRMILLGCFILVTVIILFLLIKEPLLENSWRLTRQLTPFEAAGNNILMTIRTTRPFHQKRISLLYNTWLGLSNINGSNVFLVTDGEDHEYRQKSEQLGIHYIISPCGKNYSRWSMCCKSGEEIRLMHIEKNKHYDWYCHVDDDIYIIYKNLISLLSKFDPKTEPAYIGRRGTHWFFPRPLSFGQTLFKNKTPRPVYAVGGLYCLSRPMLNKIKPWIYDGPSLGAICDKLMEPEDVSVGAVVELLGREKLSRTRLIHHHGLVLSKEVDPDTLTEQVGFAYGCGQLCDNKKYKYNAIRVPDAMFTYEEDPSRFMSLHCHLHPEEKICIKNNIRS